ncbi:hypothetical protein HWV62_31704 [Athelia sp. TMB]|nr:hypothetical protein HWV62_31704 [Athelia sp. TMB]
MPTCLCCFRASPSKRKMSKSSSPEVEIVEGPPASARPSPTKTRTRPSTWADVRAAAAKHSATKDSKRTPAGMALPSSPPHTPVAMRVRGADAKRYPSSNVTHGTPSPTKTITEKFNNAVDLRAYSDDDPIDVPSGAEAVSESGEYWGAVDDDNLPHIPPSMRDSKQPKHIMVEAADESDGDSVYTRRQKRNAKGKIRAHAIISDTGDSDTPRVKKEPLDKAVSKSQPSRRPLSKPGIKTDVISQPSAGTAAGSSKVLKLIDESADTAGNHSVHQGRNDSSPAKSEKGFVQLKRVWEFRDYKHIRSASRTVPSNLASKPTGAGNSVLIAAGSRDDVVQFATIIFTTEESHLRSLKPILNEARRCIEGVPQAGEWERMQSVLCMAHRIPSATM